MAAPYVHGSRLGSTVPLIVCRTSTSRIATMTPVVTWSSRTLKSHRAAGRDFGSLSWLRASTQPVQRRRGFADVVTKSVGDERQKVVILGSGWGGYVLAQSLDPNKYNVVLVSPRPYFVFTPLLNDTAVGTLEFRNALESIRHQKFKGSFLQGWADDINMADKIVSVEPSVLDDTVGYAMTGPRDPSVASDLDPHSTREEEIFTDLVKEGKLTMGGTGKVPVPTYPVTYDKLIIAVGAYSQTFSTPGVRENAFFLKDVNDARKIRRRVLELFELANLPLTSDEVRRHLLHIAVVGGGPTGMEFAASVSDLIHQDLAKIYPELIKYVKVTLYDVAPKVLPMFESNLADYAVKHYSRRNVEIKTSHSVLELRKGFPGDQVARANQADHPKTRVYTIHTEQDGDVGIGMCVWSTGNMNNPFIQKALNHIRRYPQGSCDIVSGTVEDPMVKKWMIQRDPRSGVMMVDDHFRLQIQTTTTDSTCAKSSDPAHDSIQAKGIMRDVFAIGDNAKLLSGPLPATAQVANQQALFLAKALNKSTSPEDYALRPGFQFANKGVMTYLGSAKAILQGPARERKRLNGSAKGKKQFFLKGWMAFAMWRAAYLSMTMSWRNRFLIPVQWFAVKLFGRDLSRF